MICHIFFASYDSYLNIFGSGLLTEQNKHVKLHSMFQKFAVFLLLHSIVPTINQLNEKAVR